MATETEFSVTWPQALAWRSDRHLLAPVGSQPAGEVVRRLGAVLSMDETLAEFAVRIRMQASRTGELARALAGGEVIKAFALQDLAAETGRLVGIVGRPLGLVLQTS